MFVSLENGSEFVLRRRDFIVLRLRHYAELPELFVKFFHEFHDAWPDSTEVMVVKHAALDCLRSEERASRVAQVLAFFVELFIYQKVFLLGPDGRSDVRCGIVAEEAQYAKRLSVDDFHRAKQRRFFVEHLAAV